ncbi:uncharacterized protein LOC143254595 [Tachypleus tridentatus]|uniref:uncharacterized protein LOC143254595 n=1 Tax=Tachypleus tridentatus TaxID=6853 RepID=UPI003FD648D3
MKILFLVVFSVVLGLATCQFLSPLPGGANFGGFGGQFGLNNFGAANLFGNQAASNAFVSSIGGGLDDLGAASSSLGLFSDGNDDDGAELDVTSYGGQLFSGSSLDGTNNFNTDFGNSFDGFRRSDNNIHEDSYH